MRKTLIASAVIGALSVPAIAVAAEEASPHSFTGNFTLASEYIYRGIGQTNRKPALQGGLDYAHTSGVYVGLWGSNVSWLSDMSGFSGSPDISSSIEIDIYGGYKGTFASDFSYDVGVLRYNYPGKYYSGFVDPDTTELYGSIGWKWISAKYSHVVSKNIFGWYNSVEGKKTRGSGYLEVNAALDLGNGFGINGHVGRQKIKNLSDASYTDWKIGGTYDTGMGVVGLAYIGTNAKGDAGELYRNAYGKDLGADRLVATFTKTF
jgi:uncharacterized protein (TIGR02001 family)